MAALYIADLHSSVTMVVCCCMESCWKEKERDDGHQENPPQDESTNMSIFTTDASRTLMYLQAAGVHGAKKGVDGKESSPQLQEYLALYAGQWIACWCLACYCVNSSTCCALPLFPQL